MFYLRENVATATNVLSARKQSDSDNCFICAKAKRQQQMFYLCESEASATNVFCAKAKRQRQMFSVAKAKRQQQMFSVAKAKRQQQMFSVRKRSVSGNCFICSESEAAATIVLSVAKAKRQLQSAQPERKSTSRYDDEPNCLYSIFLTLFS
ncbi:hypothetical protein [Lysinibacillus sp. G4S2]|uniref:hypothetical protein n=1 Tax=Lysinibacillus sp. G4S2 TaxID=3055859 RepID=UPI00259FF24E|nr:hypothetical protein [Lysinibacillus sp. G4S2]MDM5249812.1 hypothetical protein [Lysinibacillus sp. G4S2]